MRSILRSRFFSEPFNRKALCVLLVGISWFQLANAQGPVTGTFTINSHLPTAGTNFQTFSEAVLSLSSGINGPVIFNVDANSGPYKEQIIIGQLNGSSATNTVTFNCNGVTLSFNSTNNLQRAGVKLDGADYVIFDSLKVVPESVPDNLEYGYGFHLLRDADNNIIRKCTVILDPNNDNDPQDFEGIVINGSDENANSAMVSGCDNNLITENHITGGYTGVTVNGFNGYVETQLYIYGNKVTKNTIRDFHNAGIDISGTGSVLVENNDISGSFPGRAVGINVATYNLKTVISGNRIHDFQRITTTYSDPFIGISFAENPTIASVDDAPLAVNNLIYDFRTPGEVAGISANTSNFLKIYHNTISLDDVTGTSSESTRGVSLEGDQVNNTEILNNLITISRGGSGTKQAIYADGAPKFLKSDRNDLFVHGVAGTNAVGSFNGTNYATLGAWQTVRGFDFQSASQDPQYTDPATFNLIPTDSSIDNMGNYLGVNTDVVGAVRNNTHPDIGAYEFLTPPCETPILNGVTTILPATTVCTQSPVSLNLSGNSFGTGQSYQWQTSTTENGTYANTGSSLAYPASSINPTTTLYYRAQVTCGGTTVYSNPVQIIVSPKLAGGTYTINAALATTGGNYHSFNDALLAMQCGIAGPIVFNVTAGSGPYNEQVTIPAIDGASKINTITFNGNGETLTYAATSSSQRATLQLNGTDHVTISNLTVAATGASSGYGVLLTNDADSNVISKCTINITGNSTNSFAGIVINATAGSISEGGTTNCDFNVIDSNKISGGNYSVAFATGDPAPIYSNRITNNTMTDFYERGIHLYNNIDLLIEGNNISRPAITKTSSNVYGIGAGFGCSHLTISKNKIYDLFAAQATLSTATVYGIWISSADGKAGALNVVSNNLIHDIKNNNGTQYGLFNNGSDYTSYYHNTVSLDDSVTAATKAVYGFFQQGTASNIEVNNNLFTVRRKTTAVGYVLDMSATGTTYTADNNDYFLPATGSLRAVLSGGKAYTTVADWIAANLQDAHSLSVDPAYTDPANGDFKPTLMGLDDKGAPVGITTDIANKTRSATKPDIGAYEFLVCTVFPEAKVEAAGINVCNGEKATFSIQTPETGTVYNWYDVSANGTILHSGTSFVSDNITIAKDYYVQAVSDLGCTNDLRTQVTATPLAPLTQAPAPVADSVNADWVRFKWAAVPGATGYQVSTDGISFSIPSSGSTGLTHTITGLNPLQTVSLYVKALGIIECQNIVSAKVDARTLSSESFIPNMFTPNNDGRNDVFSLYGNTIRSSKMMIFNQWGEKIFESADARKGWDGTYKGKQMPVGVYIYVINMTLTNGTVENKKGTLNLIR